MTDHDRRKPGETPSQRKQKRGKKTAQQPAPQPVTKTELTQATAAHADTGVAIVEAAVSEAASAPVVALPPAEMEVVSREVAARQVEAREVAVEQAAALPAVPVSSVEASPVGLQTIASAYRDYTRKSFAEATSFVEKLAAARSLDKAVEAQTEFARQACETFAADSRKIRTLYNELFWQSLKFPGWPGREAER